MPPSRLTVFAGSAPATLVVCPVDHHFGERLMLGTLRQPGQGIAITSKPWERRLFLGPPGPRIYINGHLTPHRDWGRTFYPLPPGRHHIHMFVPSGGTWFGIGPADYVAHVHPGQVLELEYAPPVTHPSPGSLGPGPQQHIGEQAYWRSYRDRLTIVGTGVGALVFLILLAIGSKLLLE